MTDVKWLCWPRTKEYFTNRTAVLSFTGLMNSNQAFLAHRQSSVKQAWTMWTIRCKFGYMESITARYLTKVKLQDYQKLAVRRWGWIMASNRFKAKHLFPHGQISTSWLWLNQHLKALQCRLLFSMITCIKSRKYFFLHYETVSIQIHLLHFPDKTHGYIHKYMQHQILWLAPG